ncbi:MAG: RNase adapter RapZ, partial [Microthrixaceae bacterium]
MDEVVLITGLSGAGRSQAGNTLEDLGWFVIDNMPVELLAKVAELGRVGESDTQIALVAGSGADLTSVAPAVEELRELGMDVRTLFLDASTSVLVRRYSETRRRHPVFSEVGSVEAAIEAERDRLEGLRESAE